MSQKWLLLTLLISLPLFSQEKVGSAFSFDAQYFFGKMLGHNKNVAHLVKGHPNGFILSYNRKTFGEKYWQQSYNYPDWGVSLLFEDFHNPVLGQNIGLYGHYNFYFFNRSLQFRVAEGIAYNTNPFDLETNFKNNAYGSHLVGSTYILFNYYQPNIYKGLGVQAGVSLIHHSNGSFKAPNSGTNVATLNVGLFYDFEDEENPKEYRYEEIDSKTYAEKIKFNFVFRGGVNEGDNINLGQHPFYVFTVFVDKRFNYQSTLQFGVEYFVSKFLQKEIEYRAASFPNSGLKGDEDYNRASIFVGHEFRLGKFAIPSQLGYYVYWPYEYETRTYTRIGVKHYFTDTIFMVGTVKAHAVNAEAIEFGVGIRI